MSTPDDYVRDDEIIENNDDPRHANDETSKYAAKLMKQQFRATSDDATDFGNETEIETDLAGKVSAPASEAEAIIDADLPDVTEAHYDQDEELEKDLKTRRAKIIAEAEAPALPRETSHSTAKKERAAALKAATDDFEYTMQSDDGLRVASGFKVKGLTSKEDFGRYTESFHIRDQITKRTFSADDETNNRLSKALHRLKEDFDLAGTDALGVAVHSLKGSTPDYAMQKDARGKKTVLTYSGVMTLDRKIPNRKLAANRRRDGVPEAADRNGPVQRAKSIGVIDNFDPYRDDPLSSVISDAITRLEEQEAGSGPLWPVLRNALRDNWTLSNVGEAFGKSAPQASAVGTVIIGLALTTAADTYERMDDREASDVPYIDWLDAQPNGLAVPARKLKRALNPTKSPGMVFRHNISEKSKLVVANDNHSDRLNGRSAA